MRTPLLTTSEKMANLQSRALARVHSPNYPRKPREEAMMKNRREFIKTVAAAAATAMVPAGVMAQGTRGRAGRIDVHHHMIPRFQPF